LKVVVAGALICGTSYVAPDVLPTIISHVDAWWQVRKGFLRADADWRAGKVARYMKPEMPPMFDGSNVQVFTRWDGSSGLLGEPDYGEPWKTAYNMRVQQLVEIHGPPPGACRCFPPIENLRRIYFELFASKSYPANIPSALPGMRIDRANGSIVITHPDYPQIRIEQTSFSDNVQVLDDKDRIIAEVHPIFTTQVETWERQ
jgi:hypothetical protein